MDRKKYWRDKYIKDHRITFLIGLVLCGVILFYLGKKTGIELSPIGWILISLAVVVFDVLSFMRRMNDYVRFQLMEEERTGLQEDALSNIPEDDPRFEDVE